MLLWASRLAVCCILAPGLVVGGREENGKIADRWAIPTYLLSILGRHGYHAYLDRVGDYLTPEHETEREVGLCYRHEHGRLVSLTTSSFS